MKLYPFLLLLALLPLATQAQRTGYPVSAHVALTGSLIYPGLELGLDRPMIRREKLRPNGKIHLRERLLILSAAGYYHPGFHTNLWLSAGWELRHTLPGGWYGSLTPELGLSRAFPDGPVYEDDGKGGLQIRRFAGNNRLLAGAGTSLGYSFLARGQKDLRLFVKAAFLLMYPYNNGVYPRPTLKLGLSWPIHSTLSR